MVSLDFTTKTMTQTANGTPLAYPPEDLAKLGPGMELDRLVHTIVFKQEAKGKRRIPKYSEDTKLLLPVLGHLPIAFGRSMLGDAFYSEDRPYWAGHAGFDAIFTSSSLPLAASKAAVYIAQMWDRQQNTAKPADNAVAE